MIGTVPRNNTARRFTTARRHSSARVAALLLTAGVFSLALTSCSTADAPAAHTPEPSHAAADWSYAGANGPDHWGEFGAACENTSASHESPIDIETGDLATPAKSTPVVPHYTAAEFEVENNGHTIEAIPADTQANAVTFDGTEYFLQQFHFHAASEHQINGTSAAAELHLVHKSADGKLLVLGVRLDPGAANAELAELFDSMPAKSSETGVELKKLIDPSKLLPADVSSAQYDGSLTTPPCTEGVQWNVFLQSATLSPEQLSQFTDVYSDNHRPVQPLNDRTVTAVTP